jgi:L-ascorbate metabolism protein UlaG (beta-lactamase superfamily)
MVRTREHVLIFDYWTAGRAPDEPGLVNGFLDPAELAGRDVYVFVSHAHRDHFDPAVFTLRESLAGVHYVFGFPPRNPPAPCEVMEGRQTRTFGDVEVTTINSNDSGVGFLVRADGVTLFHAGDHANRRREITPDFATELDFLMEKQPAVDLAFLPVSGCGFGDPEAVRLGVELALSRLQPRVFFPMHALGGEERLAQFVAGCRDRFRGVTMQAVENRGDVYRFRDGRLAWSGSNE